MMDTIGLLHPGSMGAAFGAQLRARGFTVLWCPHGRSAATRRRAEHAGLEAAALPDLVSRCDLLLSLCPPAAAEQVAEQVAEFDPAGMSTVYVEANAVAPSRVHDIADRLTPATVIDAAVVGSPPVGGKTPTLYLSGPRELSYSSFQKVSRVLAAVAYGAAESYGVADELLVIASKRTRTYLVETDYIPKTAARAWRWGPELEDAAFLADADLPDTLMHAAATTLARWDDNRDEQVGIAEALEALRGERNSSGPG